MKKIKGLIYILYASVCIIAVFVAFLLPVSAVDSHITAKKIGVDTNELKSLDFKGDFTTNFDKCAKTRSITTTIDKIEDETDVCSSLPEEYNDFIGSLPQNVTDKLPDGAFSGDISDAENAAGELVGVAYLIDLIIDSFGASAEKLIPTFSLLCGIVILSAVSHTFASNSTGGLARCVSFATTLCSFGAISTVAISCVSRLEVYFDSLFKCVAAFVPLSGVLMAMGGNLTGAATGSMSLSATLAVCQLFFTKTVIPIFSICLSLSLISVFDGQSAFVGQSVGATVKKWYTTALSFVMMILTASTVTQSIISAKSDNAAIRGAKFAAGSFIPISGGAVSSTLGTLSSSVELLRGTVGGIGIAVILIMLIPVIVELALIRGMLGIVSFIAGLMGCSGEQRLLSEIGVLYGYLEGIAALSAVVFIISFAVFAMTASAVA